MRRIVRDALDAKYNINDVHSRFDSSQILQKTKLNSNQIRKKTRLAQVIASELNNSDRDLNFIPRVVSLLYQGTFTEHRMENILPAIQPAPLSNSLFQCDLVGLHTPDLTEESLSL